MLAQNRPEVNSDVDPQLFPHDSHIMEEYLRRSEDFQKRLGINPIPRREARYLFFRMACPLMQAKLTKFLDLSKVPVTFLHGNPHLDNYVRTLDGSAMVDFDRSRMGPYCWDLIRFLSSLSLRRQENDNFLDRKVIEYFMDAYITYFLNPEIQSRPIKILRPVQPEKWQLSSNDYLKANKKWARKMRENLISPDNEDAISLLKNFLESRNELNLLETFKVSEIGITPGSLGKKHFIFSLVPQNPDSREDAILLDIKEVYAETNTKYFYSPVDHHGLRMIEASKIYADGMEKRQGYCTFKGKQYWGRQIPSFAVKVKKFLNKEDQFDVAYSVGSELGKGHRKGLKNPEDFELVEKDLIKNFDTYLKISKLFTYELSLSFEALRRKIKLYEAFRGW